MQTFSLSEHEIFVSVRVSTVPLILVTSITLQLVLCSLTLSISDTIKEERRKSSSFQTPNISVAKGATTH